MTKELPFVISISRQLGSGGAYVGQQLASKLKLAYIDRDIINKAAQQLQVSEKQIESRDETRTPLWRSILSSSSCINTTVYLPPSISEPSDKELYQTESEIIEQISKTFSAVIVGRAGSHILRNHPRHMSIFLHAALPFRVERIKKLYKLDEAQARKFIETGDKARGIYLKAVTGLDWMNCRQYHLCIDTSVTNFDGVVKVILAYIQVSFGDISPKIE
jgi:CMP/dCMP kinase